MAGEVEVSIQLGYKDLQWFTDHATDVTLLEGQFVFLIGTDNYKRGDGVTNLGTLPWRGTLNKTAATWTSQNPILLEGQIGRETDTGRIKFGDNVTAWNSLSYFLTKRVGTVASSATPSINVNAVDVFSITALATNITSMTSGLSGTPTNLQPLEIRILDNGTARTIVWGASYVAGDIPLPTKTFAGKFLIARFLYDSTTAVFRLFDVIHESAFPRLQRIFRDTANSNPLTGTT